MRHILRWRVSLFLFPPFTKEACVKIEVTVNGEHQSYDVEPRMLLVDFLRDVVGLTGTHVGCETSLCGACSVMLNGDAVKSCTVLAVQANGAEITTIEGFAQNGELHPIQEGFWECHGLQCGFCTPGHDYCRAPAFRTQSQAQRSRYSTRYRRQSVPLYRVSTHCRCGSIRVEKNDHIGGAPCLLAKLLAPVLSAEKTPD